MTNPVSIAIARGNGIGPEIMDATLSILTAAGANIKTEEIEIGEDVYAKGVTTGIEPSAWDVLRKTKVFLKAPITTPQGGGFKSLNVTIRKSLGLFANVRPCRSYAPVLETLQPKMDMVIVRENEEDLYGGVEYRQTQGSAASLKLITRPGSERIIRYAFEYARKNGRKKVTCMSKDNIMKIADGLFHKVFDEIGAEYDDIEKEHFIIDIGSARIASRPEHFDVIVTENLYGDIISDIAAEITGSVGLCGSANIGSDFAMFEAIHGSAPDIAGQGIANPSGLLLGAVMMLVHIGQGDVAAKIHNAWLKTLEDGIHTGEIFRDGVSKEKVGTDGFAKGVIERLGQKPSKLEAVSYPSSKGGMSMPPLKEIQAQKKELVGTDIYLDWVGQPDELADKVLPLIEDGLKLEVIDNRGTKVWPDGMPETYCCDQWRLRIKSDDGQPVFHDRIISQLSKITQSGLDAIKMENLYTFDGERGWSKAQGE
ncbi:MAG: isocitrate dehydrogenase [Micavibrio sp.]|nr:isocitrate dehydrogenase [Micavibrio sp.]